MSEFTARPFTRVVFNRLIHSMIALVLILCSQAQAMQEAPDVLVKRLSQEVIEVIKSDPLVQTGDRARVHQVVEDKLLPHFDFTRMSALAMGKNWRAASPDQKQRIEIEFRTLLVHTYSGALAQYRDEILQYKPLRAKPNATDVIVKTLVMKPGRTPIQIDYSMAKTPQGSWKAYDVIVGGVSLVTNYREEFKAQIQSAGIEGLITTLTEKNKGKTAK
jgi:phospholipid transport system substrate-binding protein